MKISVSGMASVIPQGKGIECLNYHLYEGLLVRGRLTENLGDALVLFEELNAQLDCRQSDEKPACIFLEGGFELEALERHLGQLTVEASLVDALITARNILTSSNRDVRIYLLNTNTESGEVESPEQELFYLERDYVESIASSGSQYGMALQFSHEKYLESTDQKIFAILENIAQSGPESSALSGFLDEAKVTPSDIGAIELGSKEISSFDLLNGYFTHESCSVALGSVATCFSYQERHLNFLSLIKSVLQCYHRYIGIVPQWKSKNEGLAWQESGFYVPDKSRSWFVDSPEIPRYNLSFFLENGRCDLLLVSDRGVGLDRGSEFFAYACPHLFPFAANSKQEFLDLFRTLRQDLETCNSEIQVRRLARKYYQRILDQEDEIDIRYYRASLIAENKEVVESELVLLEEQIARVFDEDNRAEVKTPKGSYFTKEPLGEEGKVAFVFPGLGSSYIGLGQKIFQLFPSIFKESFRFTLNVGKELQEKTLYPRTQDPLTFKEKKQRDMDIVMNLKDLGKTDTTYSSICSHVMTDVFKVTPDMAFGYSMGEANMMTALDVWERPTDLEERFKNSDIFKTKLYGDLKTVRKLWDIPETDPSQNIWSTFTLKASKQEVEQCIRQEKLERIYLTLVNTDDNLVIAGSPLSCMQLIQKLSCRAIPMGFVPAIHCEITGTEYEGIADLYSMPTTTGCSTKLYSSSCYLPVPVRQKAIAYSIAKCFCEPVDFPKLVNKVYQDGARIFLEAGAGRTCSTWIDKILHGKKHVIVPLNAKGTEDSLTFARVMAKLFCHKVDLSLDPLYANVD